MISRAQARAVGLSPSQVDRLVASGRWRVLHRGVYSPAGVFLTPAGAGLAACLAAGDYSVVSHASAAWVWQLSNEAPAQPSITIPAASRRRLRAVQIHRREDVDLARVVIHRGIPVTDPLRTLADFGAVASPRDLDDAVDRGVASRLITVEGLIAECQRLGRQGRDGVGELRAGLRRRGLVSAPNPSVLESRTLRLLHGGGITPLACEVRTAGGRYRLDILLAPGVAMEVDGYAYHWSPEAKSGDDARRNRIRLEGTFVLQYSWTDVMHQPGRVLREASEAVAAAGGGMGTAGAGHL